MDDLSGIRLAAGVISAALLGGIIYALLRHTKLFLLILLGLFVLCIGIVIALACYERYGRGFQSVGEKRLEKRLDALMIRIRRARRFSKDQRDAIVNGYCEQLLQPANALMKAIRSMPDSAQKQELLTRKIDELERAVMQLEQLNLTAAVMDAGQIQSLEEEFRLSLDAMTEAQAAVYGGEPSGGAAQNSEQDQFYSAQQ